MWDFWSSSQGVEVVISRTGGRLNDADVKKYKASGDVINIVYNSKLDCVTALTINAVYLESGRRAAEALFTFTEEEQTRAKGIGYAGTLVHKFGTKKLGCTMRKPH